MGFFVVVGKEGNDGCVFIFIFLIFLLCMSHNYYSRGSDLSNFIGSDQKFTPYHLVAF